MDPLDAKVEAKLDVPAEKVQPGARDLSADLGRIVAKHKAPGLVAVLVVHDRVAAQGAAGVRRRGRESMVTLEDEFHFGSCGKSVTATMCALLIDQGKLSWDTTLGEVFEKHGPEVRAKMHEAWRGVTMRQLLTNRSGAPGDFDANGLWGRLVAFQGTPTAARRELLLGVTARAPKHAPGTAFEYSNAGFAIAGHVAETVMGRPYEELVRSMVFEPLGMHSAGFGAPGVPLALGDRETPIDQPRGHNLFGGAVEPGKAADNPAAIAPAGTMHASVLDWAKYATMHLRVGAGEAYAGSSWFKPETIRMLHEPFSADKDRYACGWVVSEDGTLWHNGSNTMWYAEVEVSPALDAVLVVACNQFGKAGQGAVGEAMAALRAIAREMREEREKQKQPAK